MWSVGVAGVGRGSGGSEFHAAEAAVVAKVTVAVMAVVVLLVLVQFCLKCGDYHRPCEVFSLACLYSLIHP